MNIEIERKYLIKRPDLDEIEKYSPRILNITQTYLTDNPENGAERRVRKIVENGETRYVFTEKGKLKGIGRTEDEFEITEDEYCGYLGSAVSELTKTRYAFPYEKHIMEIDIYPDEIGGDELQGKAVFEVELKTEDEIFAVPAEIEVLRELTGTREYSNKVLAKPIKM